MSRRNFGGTCCRSRSPSPSPSLVSSGSSQFPLLHPSLRPPSQSIPCLGPSTPRGSKYVSLNSSSYNTHILTAPSSLPPSQSHFPVGVHQPASLSQPPLDRFRHQPVPPHPSCYFSIPCYLASVPHAPPQPLRPMSRAKPLPFPTLASPAPCSVVCLSVGHNREPCKNGYTVEIPCGL